MIGRPSIPLGRVAGARGTTAFRHRNYRIFFAGQTISLVGTWMQQVAQAWLVLELTGDPMWLGIVAAAQFIPVLILGLFAGVAADALPKQIDRALSRIPFKVRISQRSLVLGMAEQSANNR